MYKINLRIIGADFEFIKRNWVVTTESINITIK